MFGAGRYMLLLTVGLGLALCCSLAWADVRNADPVQGEFHYGIPFLAAFAFGGLGMFGLRFAISCHHDVRPFVLAFASAMIFGQYFAIMSDLSNYDGASVWYDAFILPFYCLTIAEAYSKTGHIIGLVLPCILIVISTLAIPVSWAIHWLSDPPKKREARKKGNDETV